MTNADCIRHMSDEQLYEFLSEWECGDIDYSVTFCDLCNEATKRGEIGNVLNLDCGGCRKHWLQRDAVEYGGLMYWKKNTTFDATADRKIENSSEKSNNSTISKMEQVDKDINVRSKDEPQRTKENCKGCKYNEYPYDSGTCFVRVCINGNKYEPKDESQTEDADCDKCIWSVCNYNKAFAFEDEPQADTEIAKAIVHKMIDDAVIAEDAYPDLRQKMHDAVDEYEPQTDCAWR